MEGAIELSDVSDAGSDESGPVPFVRCRKTGFSETNSLLVNVPSASRASRAPRARRQVENASSQRVQFYGHSWQTPARSTSSRAMWAASFALTRLSAPTSTCGEQCHSDPEHEGCVQLLGRHGQPCGSVDGSSNVGCTTLRTCFAHCKWMKPRTLFNELRARHRWLLFVGDSDTRGLVLSLLQILAEAGSSQLHASRTPSLWLGDSGRKTGSRICHLDWTFSSQGQVLSTRVIPCLGSENMFAKSGRWAADFRSNASFVLTGARDVERHPAATANQSREYVNIEKDYHLHDSAPPGGGRGSARQLRVTFVTTTTPKNFLSGLRAIGAWKNVSSKRRPDFFYANTGAWLNMHPPKSSITDFFLPELNAFAREHVRAPRTLIWGTAASHRLNYVDLEVVTRLRKLGTWGILDRRKSFARQYASTSGKMGIRLSNEHMPHLVNYMDVQRMMRLLVNSTNRAREESFSRSGGAPDQPQPSCALSTSLNFSKDCAGFGVGFERLYISAYQHFCEVNLTTGE